MSFKNYKDDVRHPFGLRWRKVSGLEFSVGVRMFRRRSYKAWILCLLEIPQVTLDTGSGSGRGRFGLEACWCSSVSKALLQGLDTVSFRDSKGNVRHPFGLQWRQV